jgi:hypothetical protein
MGYVSVGDRLKQKQREQARQENDWQAMQVDVCKPTLLKLEQYQAALSVDIGRLSTIKIMEDKQAAKKTMMDVYAPFVWDYVAQGHNYPNDVAVQYMIWLFDVSVTQEEMTAALNLALYLMPHQQMPDKFTRRDIQTFVCDAVYDWAKTQLDNDVTALPLLDDVVVRLDGWRLSPPVQSKVLVIAAKHHNKAENFKTVVEYCEKAKQVNPEGWGAKTLLATAKQRL